MAISQNSTKEALARAYGQLGNWIGVFTSGGEASGGDPVYTRVQTTWTEGGDDGIIVGSQVDIDLPAGTYTHVGIFDAQTGGTLIDKKAIDAKTLDGQGKLLIKPTYTQS